jgi:integrase
LRVFELAKAKWGYITIEEKTRYYYLNVKGKRGIKRLVRIFEEVFELFVKYRESRGYSGDLFIERNSPLFPNLSYLVLTPIYHSEYLALSKGHRRGGPPNLVSYDIVPSL